MNREIKFRAFENEKGRNRMFNWSEIKKEFSEWLNCEDTFIMQYTGLKDKNGVEIYEDDILKFPFGSIAYVINDGFQIGLKSPGSEAVSYEYKEMYEVCQIIGNIHQNPELI